MISIKYGDRLVGGTDSWARVEYSANSEVLGEKYQCYQRMLEGGETVAGRISPAAYERWEVVWHIKNVDENKVSMPGGGDHLVKLCPTLSLHLEWLGEHSTTALSLLGPIYSAVQRKHFLEARFVDVGIGVGLAVGSSPLQKSSEEKKELQVVLGLIYG